MSDTVDINAYKEFVYSITSQPSKDLTTFINQLDKLDANYEAYGAAGEMQHGPTINVPLLLTAGIGLGSEGGEFEEIIKKVFFQGKPLNDETVFHMKRELGDVMFYWVNACTALGLDPNDVIAENMKKLQARYPSGFSVERSENRKAGDI
jgi:NTP pyrophosphatase (non-canonical NTP hydrolase)